LISQLEHNFSSKGEWRLITFVENAGMRVKGTELGDELGAIGRELKVLRSKLGTDLPPGSGVTVQEIGLSSLTQIMAEVTRLAERVHQLQNDVDNSANPPAQLFDYMRELRRHQAALKNDANRIRPNTYSESESKSVARFFPESLRQQFFISREKELETILNTLNPNNRLFAASLRGLGGVGKTALAVEAVTRLAPAGQYDLIIWCSAKETHPSVGRSQPNFLKFKALDDLLNSVLQAFNRRIELGFSLLDKQASVRALLSSNRCLLVCDNLETVSDPQLILEFLSNTPAPTKCVITSRQMYTQGMGERFIDLRALSLTESAEIVRHHCAQKGLTFTETEIDSIAQCCAGIPAALVWSVGRAAIDGAAPVIKDLRECANVGRDLMESCFQSSLDAAIGATPADIVKRVVQALALFPFDLNTDQLAYTTGLPVNDAFKAALWNLQLTSLVGFRETESLIDDQSREWHMNPLVRNYASRVLSIDPPLDKQFRVNLAAYFARAQKGVYVFSPANEYFRLPNGSTAADFAFEIHTDLGRKYAYALADGERIEADTPLEPGQRLTIVTDQKSMGPASTAVTTRRAKRALRVLTKDDPSPYGHLVRQGNSRARVGNIKLATEYFEKSVQQVPDQIWSYSRLGHAYRLEERYVEATTKFETVLKISPNDPFALLGLGLIRYQNNDPSAALNYFERAITAKNDYVNALVAYGRALARVGRVSEAEQHLNRAAAHCEQNSLRNMRPVTQLFLSLVHIGMGPAMYPAAEQELTTALKEWSHAVRRNSAKPNPHALYYYSMALLFASAQTWPEELQWAISYCDSSGLRKEVQNDLYVLTAEALDGWRTYVERSGGRAKVVAIHDFESVLSARPPT
jgi:tetratricopeptide (TPR) repeat protein